MPNGDVHTQIAADYLAKFDRVLTVSAVDKLHSWSTLQELGYNGQLSHLKNNFHGLQDFKQQLALYSSTHVILKTAWAVIIAIVLKNAKIALTMFEDSVMGPVGNLFKTISNFKQVFAASPDELKAVKTIRSRAQTYSATLGS